MKVERQTVAIDKKIMERLKPFADKNYRTVVGQIRFIISDWIKEQEEQP